MLKALLDDCLKGFQAQKIDRVHELRATQDGGVEGHM